MTVVKVVWGPMVTGVALSQMQLKNHTGWRNVAIKLVFLVQFLLLGYLGWFSVMYAQCGYASSIWFVYVPGFVCYLSKGYLNENAGWKFTDTGPHELFHIFVYLGHLTTMV